MHSSHWNQLSKRVTSNLSLTLLLKYAKNDIYANITRIPNNDGFSEYYKIHSTELQPHYTISFDMFFRFLTCWVLFECYLLGAEAADQTVTPTNGWDDILPLHKFGNKSYYLGNIFKATYLQAAQFCHDVHMDLVSVESKEENTFLYDLIQKDGGDDHFWTSGTRLIDGKNFIWLGTAKPIEYTNWLQGQPDNINEKCLEFWLVRNKDLYWNDRDCNTPFYFVCEKEDKKQEKENDKNWPAIFENPNVSPNVNLLNYKGKSYYFNNYFTATFLDANCFCQAIDMELVTIESDDENTRLYNYIRDTLVGDSFWSSGTRLVDDKTWIWLPTGKRVEYTHWQSGKPDNKNEKCIQLIQQRNTGLEWNDLSCTSALNFICQSPTKKYTRSSAGDGNSPSTSSPVIPVTPSPLPPKQQEQYKINAEKLTYPQAVQACKNQSMQLVSIQTKEKNEAINKLIQQRGTAEAYWTSGNQIADEKTWVWLNNEKIEYFNWNQGEPNNKRKNEFAIEIFKVGDDSKWNDAPLEFKSAYICESIITLGCGTQCCSSVVNVYVNNNVISPDGTDSKKIYSSSVSKPGQSYDVEVKNNINEEHKSENGLESVATTKIHSREHHATNKKHPGKYPGRHPDKHPETH